MSSGAPTTRSLTVQETARLLRLERPVVQTWIEQDRIPVCGPSGGEQRIRVAGLLSVLPECLGIAQAIRELDVASATISETELAASLS